MQHAGLYIHIPFCVQKCLYCDFLSYSNRAGQFSAYVNSLCRELQLRSNACKNLHFDTIFFGGGTPSCIPAENIAQLLRCCKENYSIDSNAEISMEMNPGTCNVDYMETYKQCGINRISVGIQSANDRLLKSIGRIHTIKDAKDTISLLQSNHFTNLNFDFISGIPGINGEVPENMEETLSNIDFAIQNNATHISVYSMITEPDTPLYRLTQQGHVQSVDEDTERAMYHAIRLKLIQAGFQHYEISNFALPGYLCKHNLKYWQGAPYLGVGLGSASYLPGEEKESFTRLTNTSMFEQYLLDPVTKGTCDIISFEDRKKEYMMLGFRLIAGPDVKLYQSLFQSDLHTDFRDIINTLVERKLIHPNLSLTNLGLDFENEISLEFV